MKKPDFHLTWLLLGILLLALVFIATRSSLVSGIAERFGSKATATVSSVKNLIAVTGAATHLANLTNVAAQTEPVQNLPPAPTDSPAADQPAAATTKTFLPTISVAVPTQPPVAIYADQLGQGWQDWSWDTNRNLNNNNPVQNGSASIAMTITKAWGALYLHNDSGVSTSGFNSLSFWVHGGGSGQQAVRLMVNKSESAVFTIPFSANNWTHLSIPLTNLGSPAVITDLFWQDRAGAPQPQFYLDEISLITDGSIPVPTPGTVNLTVNAAAGQHAISPYIYGINFANETLASELRLPVDRYGGNATTRYNWQNDTSNRASDWFFENIPNDNSNPGALPNGSSSDKFVEQDRRTGTATIMTVPLIGWTPIDRTIRCGFSVSKYGQQQYTDQYRPDCGNGMKQDGQTKVTGNNPADTSAPAAPSFVQAFVSHLVGRYGTAASGGVKFYNLDNEPMLWNSTHRDVHPDPVTYDELRDRTYQYAAAVKAADPSALTLGPVLWGWTAYFYSAKDAASGNWGNPPDRMAHGNLPLVEWYLQQMRAYEQSHSQRILDYLDLHYYPQSGVALTGAGGADLQAKRLRSTRSLWDPTYTDESWINEPVRLIPRMRDWVNGSYPGTKLAVTEYNFGGLESINGALAQADVLGIFGREGLDLATLWAPPDGNQPGAFAFRMYRNYNGSGGAFGETGVQATSANQDTLAIYAAQRSADGALTLMVINKSGGMQMSNLALSGFTPGASAQVYRYSSANLNAIVHEANLPVTSSGFSAVFPGSSITLIVIPKQ